MRRRSSLSTAGRRRLLALAVVAVVGRGAADRAGAPGASATAPPELRAAGLEALAYDPARRDDLAARAAAGFSYPLYAMSPGGAIASAQRTMRWRKVVDGVAERHHVDAAELEALILLESAGRPDARAGPGLAGAVGLTQILAQTATGLLGMHVDLRRSARLTRLIARGGRPAVQRRREALRRRVDERFDPRKALEATGRYLDFARRHLGGRDDLAFAGYHMGVGNLQQALSRYGAGNIPYAQLYFDSSPLRHASTWAKLSSLGDDSSTYLWRIGAAREILRLARDDPAELARRQDLNARAGSRELVLHPSATPAGSGDLLTVAASDLRSHGLRHAGRGRLALRPAALATLRLLGDGARAISRERGLTVTSTLATEPTGWSYDVARRYHSGAQAQAVQFMLDRLQALDLIAWERRPDTLHITASSRASELVRG